MPMQKRSRLSEQPARVILACWIGGLLATAMGGGIWIVLVRGGRIFQKHANVYWSFGESALLATMILAAGLILLRIAYAITPPER